MSDREALSVVLHDAVCRDRCEPQAMEEYYRQADRILARWRLVPVEQEPAHEHNWQEIGSQEQAESGMRIYYCGGLDGCGENRAEFHHVDIEP